MCGPNLIFLIEFDGLLFIPENPSAGTTSDHAEVVVLEGDDVLHLVGGHPPLGEPTPTPGTCSSN